MEASQSESECSSWVKVVNSKPFHVSSIFSLFLHLSFLFTVIFPLRRSYKLMMKPTKASKKSVSTSSKRQATTTRKNAINFSLCNLVWNFSYSSLFCWSLGRDSWCCYNVDAVGSRAASEWKFNWKLIHEQPVRRAENFFSRAAEGEISLIKLHNFEYFSFSAREELSTLDLVTWFCWLLEHSRFWEYFMRSWISPRFFRSSNALGVRCYEI